VPIPDPCMQCKKKGSTRISAAQHCAPGVTM
jgi:hypothetical protein